MIAFGSADVLYLSHFRFDVNFHSIENLNRVGWYAAFSKVVVCEYSLVAVRPLFRLLSMHVAHFLC